MKPPKLLVLTKRDRKLRHKLLAEIRNGVSFAQRLGIDESVAELDLPPEHFSVRLVEAVNAACQEEKTVVARAKRYPVRVTKTRVFCGPYEESCELSVHRFVVTTFIGNLAGKFEFQKNSLQAQQILAYYKSQFTKKGKRRK